MNITKKLISVNYSGRGGVKVIQYTPHTAVTNADSLYAYFNNPASQSSSHYYVNKYGNIEQYVEESNMAWTNSNLNANRQSITCEHWDGGNANDSVRTNEMYESAAQLMADVCKRNNIPLVLLTKEQALANQPGITLHKYYANKSCPGALNVQRIIDRALVINNTPMPIDAQIAHDGSNLVGYKLSDEQARFETNAWATVYGKSYGKWYETFRMNKQCQEFDIGALNTMYADSQKANQELKALVASQEETIHTQGETIQTLGLELSAEKEKNQQLQDQVSKLQQDLLTCQAGNTQPDIVIRIWIRIKSLFKGV